MDSLEDFVKAHFAAPGSGKNPAPDIGKIVGEGELVDSIWDYSLGIGSSVIDREYRWSQRAVLDMVQKENTGLGLAGHLQAKKAKFATTPSKTLSQWDDHSAPTAGQSKPHDPGMDPAMKAAQSMEALSPWEKALEIEKYYQKVVEQKKAAQLAQIEAEMLEQFDHWQLQGFQEQQFEPSKSGVGYFPESSGESPAQAATWVLDSVSSVNPV